MQRRGEVAHRRCRRFAHNTDAATGLWVSPSCEAPTNSTTRAAAERTRLTGGVGNGHISREGGRDNRSILRVSGEQLEAACERTHETAAPPRTNGDSAQAACAAPAPLAPPRPSPHPQHPNETPRNGKIRASCMIRGVCAAKRPLRGEIFARCIPERRFAGHFGYMARESCQSQLILDAWRRYVARKGRFSRPRHLLGYMKRKTCHGLPPGNAPGRNIAIARHPRTHRGVTESKDATRTKRRPIQHRMLTRPRNHENILVPSAKKRR